MCPTKYKSEFQDGQESFICKMQFALLKTGSKAMKRKIRMGKQLFIRNMYEESIYTGGHTALLALAQKHSGFCNKLQVPWALHTDTEQFIFTKFTNTLIGKFLIWLFM